ncbi:glycosyltransferase [Bacteroidetes/Chlorobi group bacterium Naka2016]|jgi:glycosyltransferase involved in cell wall biosynthesis|nr:MAG: glycosyltransferase [Bacteroidetes/Chlorobi group bacterium Naka2016]
MRKKILLVLHRIPYPPVGGDNITNFNTVKILNKYFDLDIVVVTYEDYSKEAEEFLKNHSISCKIFKYPLWKCKQNALKTLLNFKPFQVNFFYFKEVQKYINSIVDDADLIFAGIIRIADYLYHFGKPKILNMADSIGLNYKYSYRRTKSLFWKIFYFLEYPLMLRYERKMIEKFDRTLMFNKREIEYFSSSKIIKIPQGVKPELLTYEKEDPQYKNYISYFGKMNYRPNVDAVLWFVHNVFPYLPQELYFQIIGANPVPEIMELQNFSPRIKVLGFVEDPYLLLKSSLCTVAPMQTGGGIQNKILETMALGTIVITTPYSAFPIASKEDNALLIAEKPEEWISLINDIYKTPDKYQNIKQNSREYIKSHFTFEKFEEKLLDVIEEVISKK